MAACPKLDLVASQAPCCPSCTSTSVVIVSHDGAGLPKIPGSVYGVAADGSAPFLRCLACSKSLCLACGETIAVAPLLLHQHSNSGAPADTDASVDESASARADESAASSAGSTEPALPMPALWDDGADPLAGVTTVAAAEGSGLLEAASDAVGAVLSGSLVVEDAKLWRALKRCLAACSCVLSDAAGTHTPAPAQVRSLLQRIFQADYHYCTLMAGHKHATVESYAHIPSEVSGHVEGGAAARLPSCGGSAFHVAALNAFHGPAAPTPAPASVDASAAAAAATKGGFDALLAVLQELSVPAFSLSPSSIGDALFDCRVVAKMLEAGTTAWTEAWSVRYYAAFRDAILARGRKASASGGGYTATSAQLCQWRLKLLGSNLCARFPLSKQAIVGLQVPGAATANDELIDAWAAELLAALGGAASSPLAAHVKACSGQAEYACALSVETIRRVTAGEPALGYKAPSAEAAQVRARRSAEVAAHVINKACIVQLLNDLYSYNWGHPFPATEWVSRIWAKCGPELWSIVERQLGPTLANLLRPQYDPAAAAVGTLPTPPGWLMARLRNNYESSSDTEWASMMSYGTPEYASYEAVTDLICKVINEGVPTSTSSSNSFQPAPVYNRGQTLASTLCYRLMKGYSVDRIWEVLEADLGKTAQGKQWVTDARAKATKQMEAFKASGYSTKGKGKGKPKAAAAATTAAATASAAATPPSTGTGGAAASGGAGGDAEAEADAAAEPAAIVPPPFTPLPGAPSVKELFPQGYFTPSRVPAKHYGFLCIGLRDDGRFDIKADTAAATATTASTGATTANDGSGQPKAKAGGGAGNGGGSGDTWFSEDEDGEEGDGSEEEVALSLGLLSYIKTGAAAPSPTESGDDDDGGGEDYGGEDYDDDGEYGSGNGGSSGNGNKLGPGGTGYAGGKGDQAKLRMVAAQQARKRARMDRAALAVLKLLSKVLRESAAAATPATDFRLLQALLSSGLPPAAPAVASGGAGNAAAVAAATALQPMGCYSVAAGPIALVEALVPYLRASMLDINRGAEATQNVYFTLFELLADVVKRPGLLPLLLARRGDDAFAKAVLPASVGTATGPVDLAALPLEALPLRKTNGKVDAGTGCLAQVLLGFRLHAQAFVKTMGGGGATSSGASAAASKEEAASRAMLGLASEAVTAATTVEAALMPAATAAEEKWKEKTKAEAVARAAAAADGTLSLSLPASADGISSADVSAPLSLRLQQLKHISRAALVGGGGVPSIIITRKLGQAPIAYVPDKETKDSYEGAIADEAFCSMEGLSESHYFAGEARSGTAAVGHNKRLMRVAAEMSTLATGVGVAWGSSILVRSDESSMNLLRASITGPSDTPYMNGWFQFDIFLPNNYPDVNPKVQFLTTGGGQVRFNPNLYMEGKVCLSLLGTWDGPGWVAGESTLTQVLVSIQALILVSSPYANEPGYERNLGSEKGQRAVAWHNAKLRLANIRHAMLDALKTPPKGFEEAVKAHFYYKREELKAQCIQWCEEALLLARYEEALASSGEATMADQLRKTLKALDQVRNSISSTLASMSGSGSRRSGSGSSGDRGAALRILNELDGLDSSHDVFSGNISNVSATTALVAVAKKTAKKAGKGGAGGAGGATAASSSEETAAAAAVNPLAAAAAQLQSLAVSTGVVKDAPAASPAGPSDGSATPSGLAPMSASMESCLAQLSEAQTSLAAAASKLATAKSVAAVEAVSSMLATIAKASETLVKIQKDESEPAKAGGAGKASGGSGSGSASATFVFDKPAKAASAAKAASKAVAKAPAKPAQLPRVPASPAPGAIGFEESEVLAVTEMKKEFPAEAREAFVAHLLQPCVAAACEVTGASVRSSLVFLLDRYMSGEPERLVSFLYDPDALAMELMEEEAMDVIQADDVNGARWTALSAAMADLKFQGADDEDEEEDEEEGEEEDEEGDEDEEEEEDEEDEDNGYNEYTESYDYQDASSSSGGRDRYKRGMAAVAIETLSATVELFRILDTLTAPAKAEEEEE